MDVGLGLVSLRFLTEATVPKIAFSANIILHGGQGKVAELRQELTMGGKKDKNHSAKKIALKKIVANMTMSNNDMVALFPDIISCMQIQSLEIKKMYVCKLFYLSGHVA